MAVIYCPTRSEERIIGRIHRRLRQRFREIRDDPKIGKREKGKQLKLFRFANLAACSEGPARLRELIGEEKYDRLLRMKLRRR